MGALAARRASSVLHTGGFHGRHRGRGPRSPALHGLRPGAAPRHVNVQQLRDQLLDHLDPGRWHDELLARHGHQRPAGDHDGMDHRRVLRAPRGHGHGRDLLGLSHCGRPVLLVGEAGTEEPGPLVVVHRLLQPHRPDRRHRQRRLRAVGVHRLLHPHVRRRLQAHRREDLHHLPHRAGGARPAQHVPHRPREGDGRHQRVVARDRCGHHRRRAVHRAQQQARHRGRLRRSSSRAHRLDGRCVRHHLSLRARSTAGAVHDHRFRCIRARQRGDRGRSHRGAEGDRALDLHLRHRRPRAEPFDESPRCRRRATLRMGPSSSATRTTRSSSMRHRV